VINRAFCLHRAIVKQIRRKDIQHKNPISINYGGVRTGFLEKEFFKKEQGERVMKRITIIKLSFILAISAVWTFIPVPKAVAQDGIKYRCSHQIFNALEDENLQAFTKETGIKVDVKAYPSDVAVNLLINGYCDIASTARQIDSRQEEKGYKQTAICNDPLAIIANAMCGIDNVTEKQLEDIFSGDIKNWKELGGPDLPIIVIVPAENTAANKNFMRFVMKHKEMKFSIMTATSELVIEQVKYLPVGSISFFSHGAALQHKEIKILTVNGISTNEANYPFIQTFYYVTKGEPTGQIKKLIDFTLSEKGSQIIKKNGMIPVMH
jgi:phosphate transport system substrate-binding protein